MTYLEGVPQKTRSSIQDSHLPSIHGTGLPRGFYLLNGGQLRGGGGTAWLLDFIIMKYIGRANL